MNYITKCNLSSKAKKNKGLAFNLQSKEEDSFTRERIYLKSKMLMLKMLQSGGLMCLAFNFKIKM